MIPIKMLRSLKLNSLSRNLNNINNKLNSKPGSRREIPTRSLPIRGSRVTIRRRLSTEVPIRRREDHRLIPRSHRLTTAARQ